jgi:hypothetical protein
MSEYRTSGNRDEKVLHGRISWGIQGGGPKRLWGTAMRKSYMAVIHGASREGPKRLWGTAMKKCSTAVIHGASRGGPNTDKGLRGTAI